MKILITGHKGFIGQNITKALSEHDLSFFEWGDDFPIISNRSFDWIIHLGAISSTTESNVDKVMTQNYDFSVRLFELCRQYNINLQYSSSASVYGKNHDFSEDSPANPLSPYAWSKYLFDRYVSKNIHKCTNIVHGFRYFNVCGPHEDHKGNQASPFHKFRLEYETTGKVTVFENSANYKRDFIHVDNVVKTHIEFFKVKESDIWNVGTGKTMSFLDVAREITDNIVEIPFPKNLKCQYQAYTKADLTKMRATANKYCLDLSFL